MNYTTKQRVRSIGDVPNCFMIPHGLEDFRSISTTAEVAEDGRELYIFDGQYDPIEDNHYCACCGTKMHINRELNTNLRHLPYGNSLTFVRFSRKQYRCPNCGKTEMERIPFRAEHHRMTKALEDYIRKLLARGYTNKEIENMTGADQCAVKAIDKERLRLNYTESEEGDDGSVSCTLKKPETYSTFLIIDEFKLHNNYQYATHIVDAATGHILWIDHGKNKDVIYRFIDHVGDEWMSHVEAVACDMNSDFQEAFEERCEWIQPVFDHFHIVKNFNEKVISAVRKDEQKRLSEAGDTEAARALKHTKYILTSDRKTLRRKDAEAAEGKVLSKADEMFHRPQVNRHGGYEQKYNELLKQNKLLFTVDLVKEQLADAYTERSENAMADKITQIINICNATGNAHFKWFARLLSSHFEGIIAHATYNISTGKIEGINRKINTIRNNAYGYPDDDYFFLKVIDASYKPYVRNLQSHKISN